jgi:hypothetical protein
MPVNVLVTRGKGASNPDWARIVTFETFEEAMAYCDRIEPKVKGKHWEMGTIMPATGYAPLTWPEVCDD